MRGISRASLAEVEERLEPLTASAQAATALGDELFSVAGLLATQPALRRALSDPSRSAAGQGRPRDGSVLSGKVSDEATGLVAAVAAARWSAPGDLTDAVEQLARAGRGRRGRAGGHGWTSLEDELFRFGRIVASQPDLRIALTNPFVSAAEAKRSC